MTELALLHESVVDETEIDSLGHMNVRYYVMRMVAANHKLFETLGVASTLAQGQRIQRIDTYNRFHREQFTGAKLNTFGGLVTAEGVTDSQGITAYFEIRNHETSDVAATFIVTSGVIETSSQTQAETPAVDAELASQYTVQLPNYGLPRSLSLTKPKPVTLAELEPHIPVNEQMGNFNGRREGKVLPEDCDANGRLREDIDPMFILHRPGSEEEAKSMGPPVLFDQQGRRYSWAIMENRIVLWQRPEANDAIVSLSADLKIGEKWRQTRRWLFSKDSSALLGVTDHVALCMDLDARRAIPVPEELKENMVNSCLPEFA